MNGGNRVLVCRVVLLFRATKTLDRNLGTTHTIFTPTVQVPAIPLKAQARY